MVSPAGLYQLGVLALLLLFLGDLVMSECPILDGIIHRAQQAKFPGRKCDVLTVSQSKLALSEQHVTIALGKFMILAQERVAGFVAWS